MVKTHLNILQVNTYDIYGGAEKIAWTLHHDYLSKGHNALFAVGTKKSEAPKVLTISHDAYRNLWARFWLSLSGSLSLLENRIQGVSRLQKLVNYTIGQPHALLGFLLGHESFNFPATAHLLENPGQQTDILHCHNLHRNYFDLRALPYLSRQVPLIITLHDAWLLSGHCAHSFDCDRWKVGCGHCPDLSIYPAIRRDATARNWQSKQAIYSNSRLYIATPSHWLMDKVKQSMLNPAMVEGRVIPNGIDLSIFHPGNQPLVRRELGIPQDAKVLLFTASGIRNNIWKDYQTMRTVVAMLAERMQDQSLLFIALGEDGPTEYIGQAKIQFVSFKQDPTAVARYYQAANVYIHAAKADTFPTTVLESLACGTPVVATSVGGIPEQIQDGATGFLVPAGNAEQMAIRIQQLLEDSEQHRRMSQQAANAARHYFNIEVMSKNYLSWYQEILNAQHREKKTCTF